VLQTKVVGDGKPQRLNTRKADVAKPLLAVCDMVDKGHAVLFDAGGSYAVNKKTGLKTLFHRNGKEWELKLQLEAPEQANTIYAGLMAELAETTARNSQPEVSLQIGAGVEPAILGRGDNGMAKTSSFLSGREEPLFRLAVHP
jgi:hypothetical protein